MIWRSQRLRLSDIHGVYAVVGRVLEARRDPDTWRAVALSGLCERVGGSVGLTADMVGVGPGETPRPVSPLDVGWTDAATREIYYNYITSGQMHDDPGTIALLQMHARVRFVTRTRRQMVDDDRWYASPAVTVARRAGNVDDFVCSTVLLRPGVLQGFIAYRPCGATPFGERERRLARLLHVRLLRLMAVPAGTGESPQLSPRLRQTLELLCAGEGVKQIAQTLELSPHTVGDYVKALYQKYGVCTRGELLSRCHALQNRPHLRLPPELLAAVEGPVTVPA